VHLARHGGQVLVTVQCNGAGGGGGGGGGGACDSAGLGGRASDRGGVRSVGNAADAGGFAHCAHAFATSVNIANATPGKAAHVPQENRTCTETSVSPTTSPIVPSGTHS